LIKAILFITGVYRLKNRRIEQALQLVSLVLVSLLACALVCSSSARPAFANALVDKHNKVGTDAFEHARYAEAERSFLSAIKVTEASGPNGPDVATSLCNLAGLYKEHKSSLSIFEKAYGPRHPNLATVLDNYAAVLRKTNRAKEAVALEARAEAMRPAK
jgi:Tfp pilus assembly protein PilF